MSEIVLGISTAALYLVPSMIPGEYFNTRRFIIVRSEFWAPGKWREWENSSKRGRSMCNGWMMSVIATLSLCRRSCNPPTPLVVSHFSLDVKAVGAHATTDWLSGWLQLKRTDHHV